MHDHLLLLIAAFVGTLVLIVGYAVWDYERTADRSKLPGSLRGDDPSLPFEEAS